MLCAAVIAGALTAIGPCGPASGQSEGTEYVSPRAEGTRAGAARIAEFRDHMKYGEYELALAAGNEALFEMRLVLGLSHPRTVEFAAEFLPEMAAFGGEDDRNLARRLVEDVLDAILHTEAGYSPHEPDLLLLLAELAARDDPERAAAYLERATERTDFIFGPASREATGYLLLVAGQYDLLDETEKADLWFDIVLDRLLREGYEHSSYGGARDYSAFETAADAFRDSAYLRRGTEQGLQAPAARSSMRAGVALALAGRYRESAHELSEAYQRLLIIEPPSDDDNLRATNWLLRIFLTERDESGPFPPMESEQEVAAIDIILDAVGGMHAAGFITLPALVRKLAIAERGGLDTPEAAIGRVEVAHVYRELDMERMAVELMSSAVPVFREAGPAYGADLAGALAWLASLRFRDGDAAGARPMLEEAVAAIEAVYGPIDVDAIRRGKSLDRPYYPDREPFTFREGAPDPLQIYVILQEALAAVDERLDIALAERVVAHARAHDRAIRGVEEAEARRRDAPDDRDALRALMKAYLALLAFERDTPLGSNTVIAASRLLPDLENPDSATADDLHLGALVRATGFTTMGLYPEAVTLLAGPLADAVGAETPNDAVLLAEVIDEIGQGGFALENRFEEGPLEVLVYRTVDEPPDHRLVWPILHLIASAEPDAPPHRTMGFALVRQDRGAGPRYYLLTRELDRPRLVALYGETEPPRESVELAVRRVLSGSFALLDRGDE